MGNVIINDAIWASMKRMKVDVDRMKNTLSRLGVSGPRTESGIYARITSNIAAGEYAAEEVLFDGTGSEDWSTAPGGRTWGTGGSDVGKLYAIDSDSTTLTGVYKVVRFSDGDGVYWGFQPADTTPASTPIFSYELDGSTKVVKWRGFWACNAYRKELGTRFGVEVEFWVPAGEFRFTGGNDIDIYITENSMRDNTSGNALGWYSSMTPADTFTTESKIDAASITLFFGPTIPKCMRFDWNGSALVADGDYQNDGTITFEQMWQYTKTSTYFYIPDLNGVTGVKWDNAGVSVGNGFSGHIIAGYSGTYDQITFDKETNSGSYDAYLRVASVVTDANGNFQGCMLNDGFSSGMRTMGFGWGTAAEPSFTGTQWNGHDFSVWFNDGRAIRKDSTNVSVTAHDDFTTEVQSIIDAGGYGDVFGPASSTNNNIAVFDGATGKLIADGGSTIAQVRDRATHTGTQVANTISDFQATVTANVDVAANTTHRTSDGTDHTFIDQDVRTTATPTFAGAAFTAFPTTPVAAPATDYEVANKKYVDDNAGGGGDVTGPASATDQHIAVFSGITGKIIADGGSTIADVLNRANHTGTQTASTISDFATNVSNNPSVLANTAKVSADGSVTTHSDVNDAGSGSIITTAERNNLANQSGTNTGDEALATETVAGIAEIATQAETDAGLVDDRIVTPLKLANWSGGGDVNGGSNLTTQYRMVYVASAGTITESASIVTDAAGGLRVGTTTAVGSEILTVDGGLYTSDWIKTTSGSVSNLAVRVGVDNWGFYRNATQGLKVVTNGNQMMTFDNNGLDIEAHVPMKSVVQSEEGAFQADQTITGSATDDIFGFHAHQRLSNKTGAPTGTPIGIAGFKGEFEVISGVLTAISIGGVASFWSKPDFSGTSNKTVENFYGLYCQDSPPLGTGFTVEHQCGVYIEAPTRGTVDNCALVTTGGDVRINTGNLDADFTINKLTAGAAYVYDAGLDTHTFNSPVTATSLTLGAGATVDTIETTLTDDDTHIPTSGAVVDYVASVGGDVSGGSNLTTQYRMVYVASASTVTESANIITDASGNLTVTNTGADAYQQVRRTDGLSIIMAARSGLQSIRFDDSADLTFAKQPRANMDAKNNTGITYLARLKNSGEFWVGTTAAIGSELLTVGGSGGFNKSGASPAVLVNRSDGKTTALTTTATNSALYFDDSGYLAFNKAPKADINFETYTGAAELARITSGGALLIGTTAAVGTELLTVDGEASIDGISIWDGGATTNVYVGQSAGSSDTGATNNAAFGHDALKNITTADKCTAVGSLAGRAIATNGEMTAIGYNALGSESTSNRSTAVGAECLRTSNGGAENTAMGYQCLFSVTTGDRNIAMGYLAGKLITAGTALQTPTNSCFVGADTRASADGNTNENVFGYGAYGNGSNTATWGNTSITDHYFTGNINTDTIRVGTTAAVGSELLTVDGEANISGAAIIDSLYFHSAGGTDCIFIGEDVASLSGAEDCVGVGINALAALTSGDRHTAVGYQALSKVTTVQNCSAFGYRCFVNATGQYNTGLGSVVGFKTTTGTDNTLVGFFSLYNNVTTSQNSTLGVSTLANITNGGTNLALGYQSANQQVAGGNLTDWTQGVAVGPNARGTEGATNEIAIGYNTYGNGSNTATWGNTSITDHYFNGDLHITGSILHNVTAYTANQTLDGEDGVVICKTNAFTVTLPAAASNNGRRYYIKNAAANTGNDITVDGNGAETIDGETTVTLPPGACAAIVCDGTEWHII